MILAEEVDMVVMEVLNIALVIEVVIVEEVVFEVSAVNRVAVEEEVEIRQALMGMIRQVHKAVDKNPFMVMVVMAKTVFKVSPMIRMIG